MRGRAAAAAAAIALLAPAVPSGAAGASAAPPRRVTSLNQCADQLVLALLPPERIASVTWLSRDPTTSRMAREARAVAVNHGQGEEVVRDAPDLVVAGTYTTPALRGLLARLRYRVLLMPADGSFADIRRSVRRLAAAVGETARGEALIARMDATLAELARDPAPPLRVAAWDGAGFSARPGSLYDAILRAAGARNVADDTGVFASGAPGVETLLAVAPQLLVAGLPSVDDTSGRRGDVARHPLVRRFWGDRTVIAPQSAYVCGTPFSADAARDLRAQMRAKLAQARTPLPFSATPAR